MARAQVVVTSRIDAESWLLLPSANIEFTMKRLREPK
jgi:hypothetical protein